MGKRDLKTYLLRAILFRYGLFIILTFIVSNIFGQQTKLPENLVADSIILKLKIRQIIEHSGTVGLDPSWTTIEIFDTTGKIIQRTNINYYYHKFVSDFTYNEKRNEIEVITKYYDWGPHRLENKGDTVLSISIERYNLKSKINRKFRHTMLAKFPTRKIFDSIGRLFETIDTMQCGQKVTCYAYDNNENVIEKKSYEIVHSDTMMLWWVVYCDYNINGVKTKETKHYGFQNTNISQYSMEDLSNFQFNDLGLLKEKLITKRFLTLKDSKPSLSFYKYEYEFYK